MRCGPGVDDKALSAAHALLASCRLIDRVKAEELGVELLGLAILLERSPCPRDQVERRYRHAFILRTLAKESRDVHGAEHRIDFLDRSRAMLETIVAV